MSEYRSVSMSASGGKISVDASLAQELVEFLTRRYEQVKEELEQLKNTSASDLSSPQDTSSGGDDRGIENRTGATDETEVLRVLIKDLEKKLATSEQQRLALLQQMQCFIDENAALASEADASRLQKIHNIYPLISFLPAGMNLAAFRFASPEALSEKITPDLLAGRPLCTLPRPPACLPIRVNACGRHGYWFSPLPTFPENFEFELVAEGRPTEWTYLGKYVSVHLPGGEMRMSEWLAIDDEVKDVHCTRVAAQKLGAKATPAAICTAAAELKQQYKSGKETVPCFALVCTGFTMQVHEALCDAAAPTRKRKLEGQAGGKRAKIEANSRDTA